MTSDTTVQIEVIFQNAYGAICAGEIDAANAALASGRSEAPLDYRFNVMAAALAQFHGKKREAMEFLWAALAADPHNSLVTDELVRLALTPVTDPTQIQTDYSLLSGERQIGSSRVDLRTEHRARYDLVAQWLRRSGQPSWSMTGIDAFCGDGYGSHILSTKAGVRMIGVDASFAAIALASKRYSSHRVKFAHFIFPFELCEGIFDFGISFESVEHVVDYERLIEQLAHATRGPLFISVPNERAMPFNQFGRRFGPHTRHFERDDIVGLLVRTGLPNIMAEFGQQVYRIEDGDLIDLLPESEMRLRSFDPERSQVLVVVADRE